MPKEAMSRKNGNDLLGICRMLHESNCGSGTDLNTNDLEYNLTTLEIADKSWKESLSYPYSEYENAVRNLIRATINETKVSLSERRSIVVVKNLSIKKKFEDIKNEAS